MFLVTREVHLPSSELCTLHDKLVCKFTVWIILCWLLQLYECFTVINDGVGQLPSPVLQCGGSAVNSTQEATVFLSTISHR